MLGLPLEFVAVEVIFGQVYSQSTSVFLNVYHYSAYVYSFVIGLSRADSFVSAVRSDSFSVQCYN
jgi:hypothetical protein